MNRKQLSFFDETGKKIYHMRTERKEQLLAQEYVKPHHHVLELGARYGTVSVCAAMNLENQRNLVVVEPDRRVWKALEENMRRNLCDFHIVYGFVSRRPLELTNFDDWNGYGTTSVPCNESNEPRYTVEQLEEQYNLRFTALIADCEGFLERFLDENPFLYDQLELMIFEKDYPKKCDYKKIKNNLLSKGFQQRVSLFREVWVKENLPEQ